MASLAPAQSRTGELSEEEIVDRVLQGEVGLFEILMRRYNQRLYRVARAITRNEAQAEDVMQAAYLHSYEHLAQFSGSGSFSAWLTRIAVNESLHRIHDRKHFRLDQEDSSMDRFASPAPDPEQAAAQAEVRALLEAAIDGLPDSTRTVFVLRDVDGLSTAEASEALGISEDNVKVRLHRARRGLRKQLATTVHRQTTFAYAFHATRCDRVVHHVLTALRAEEFQHPALARSSHEVIS